MTNEKLPVGFTTRAATMADIPELTRLFNATSMLMKGIEDFTENEIEIDFKTSGFNLETDSHAVCNSAGQIVAYADVFAVRKPAVYPYNLTRVHPDYMNQGLGTCLMTWAKQRAEQVIPDVPANARVALRTGVFSDFSPATELFQNLGMHRFRSWFTMKIDLTEKPPAAVWPAGLTLTTYQHPQQAEAVYRAVDDAFKDHYGHIEEEFEAGFKRFKDQRFQDEHFDPSLWYLVMDGDEIAALALNRKQGWEGEQDGHVSILGVRRPWRKRGLALALLHHTFNQYWQMGKKAVTLGVDAESLTGAVKLYEKAGMYVFRRNDGYEWLLRDGEDLSTTTIE